MQKIQAKYNIHQSLFLHIVDQEEYMKIVYNKLITGIVRKIIDQNLHTIYGTLSHGNEEDIYGQVNVEFQVLTHQEVERVTLLLTQLRGLVGDNQYLSEIKNILII